MLWRWAVSSVAVVKVGLRSGLAVGALAFGDAVARPVHVVLLCSDGLDHWRRRGVERLFGVLLQQRRLLVFELRRLLAFELCVRRSAHRDVPEDGEQVRKVVGSSMWSLRKWIWYGEKVTHSLVMMRCWEQ